MLPQKKIVESEASITPVIFRKHLHSIVQLKNGYTTSIRSCLSPDLYSDSVFIWDAKGRCVNDLEELDIDMECLDWVDIA